jgi:hypothetical protein
MKRTILLTIFCPMLSALLFGCGDDEPTEPTEGTIVGYWKLEGPSDVPSGPEDYYLALLSDGTLCEQRINLVDGEETCGTGTYTCSGTQCLFTYPLDFEPWEITFTFTIVALGADMLCFKREGPDAPPEPTCWNRISPSQFLCDCP